MSELKSFNSERIYWAVEQVERIAGDIDTLHLDDNQFYLKSEVDDAITELKEKLESVQASAYAESVDAGTENRKLKRAMWVARAERAHVTTLLWNVYCYQNNCLYFRDFMPENCNPFRSLPKKTAMEWSDLWESIETKCRAKAEEYK